jgi:purine-binding chemotaxis protein CheW
VEGGGTLLALAQDVVREIVPARQLTRLPGAPAAVRGLLNVRGTLITVLDLAERFGHAPAATGDASVVIGVTGGRTLGLLVDDVHEVTEFADGDFVPPDAAVTDAAVMGLGHFGERIVLAVDLQELARQTLA